MKVEQEFKDDLVNTMREAMLDAPDETNKMMFGLLMVIAPSIVGWMGDASEDGMDLPDIMDAYLGAMSKMALTMEMFVSRGDAEMEDAFVEYAAVTFQKALESQLTKRRVILREAWSE